MFHRSKFALAIAGLMVLLGSGPSRAGCATSDGRDNTACGSAALVHNITGNANTASGYQALDSNTTGYENAASGEQALFSNTAGFYNTASGYQALFHNQTGASNTASGDAALYHNTTGFYNTASGDAALLLNTTGAHNTALGVEAGDNNVTGSGNTFVGALANSNSGGLQNGTALGQGAMLTASNSIVLGNTAITRIYAKVTSITAISDRRQKQDIAALDPALGLALIAKLKPVSYRFKGGDETERYGFIAQDLEQTLPQRLRDQVENAPPGHGLALIERENDTARTYRLSYGELTAPLVKAIQQQQAQIAAQRQEIAELRDALAALQKRVGAMKVAQSSP